MTNVLNRQDAMLENTDPKGVRWGVFPQQGKSLYLIKAIKRNEEGRIIPDQRYAIPKECEGEWTHSHKAQFAIEQYLRRFWDESDAQAEKAASKRRDEKRVVAEVSDILDEEQLATN